MTTLTLNPIFGRGTRATRAQRRKMCVFLTQLVALTGAPPARPLFQILTKDSVTVNVDAIMYYKVSNATSAISNVDDYSQSTRLLAATTLRFDRSFGDYRQFFFKTRRCRQPSRNVLGTKNLGDILSDREVIAAMMQSTLDEATDPWGVKVERVEV